MGSWSSSAPTLPTGAYWSSEVSTGNCSDEYYKAYAKVAAARGTGSTIYLRVHLYCWLKKQGEGARTFPVKCQANDGSGDVTSGNVACGGDQYGYWADKGYRYYTGTAAPGGTLRVRLLQDHDSTDAVLSAPAYVTAYAVTYDGNGAEGGATEAQSKLYDTALTLRQNGFTRRGWGFTGWNTAADGTGTAYAAGASYTANAALALYAQWERTNIPVYMNDGGAVEQEDECWIRDGDTLSRCDLYINDGGVIVPLT